MSAQAPLRILIVDDHELFRDGLREILAAYPDFTVAGEAGSQAEALAAVAASADIDVMLLDVGIPEGPVTATVAAVRELRPGLSVIILTMYNDGDILRSLLALGIRGYILKTASRHELASAIRATRSKGNKVTLAVGPEILVEGHGQESPPRLSQPEADVLRLAARALTNAQIGRELSLSEPTVKRHMRGIFAKLGAVSRIDAVNKAAEAGLLAGSPAPRPT